MKIVLLLFLVSSLNSFGQKAFYKQTISAYEIIKKDTISRKILITYLDSLRNVITSENNIANAIPGKDGQKKKLTSFVIVNSDLLSITADLHEKGDTINKMIYVYDSKKNRIENYQIREGDTVVGQKRTFDDAGNQLNVRNRKKNGQGYFLSMEWKYDSYNNELESKTYNEEGKLIRFDKYENVYKDDDFEYVKSTYINAKGFVKQAKGHIRGNTTTTYFYHDSVGYNYGMKIINEDGGYSVREDDNSGNLKELKIYDSRKNLKLLVKSKEIRL